MTRKRTRRIGAALALFMAACGDGDDAAGEEALADASSPVVRGDAGRAAGPEKPDVLCDGRRDGTACGEAGSGFHCVIEACAPNRCGDGLRAEAEECDDGNLRDGDGCSRTCLTSALPTDASRADAGAQASGAVDAALSSDAATSANDAEADAGGASDSGGGETATDAAQAMDSASEDSGSPDSARPDSGSADSGSPDGALSDASSADGNIGDGATSDSGGSDAGGVSCSTCRNANCRADKNPDGIDVVAGCLEAIQTDIVPLESRTPTFLQDCINVITCAQQNSCAYTLPSGPAGCYCGSNEPTTCVNVGAAANAKCVPQWQTATGSTVNSVIQGRFTAIEYPAGWAYALLQCDAASCPSCTVAGAR